MFSWALNAVRCSPPSGAGAAPRGAPGRGHRTAPSGGGAFPNNSGKAAADTASAAWLMEQSSADVRSVTFHGYWTKATETPFYSRDK